MEFEGENDGKGESAGSGKREGARIDPFDSGKPPIIKPALTSVSTLFAAVARLFSDKLSTCHLG